MEKLYKKVIAIKIFERFNNLATIFLYNEYGIVNTNLIVV